MPALREVAQVVHTDPREGSHLGIGEYFLARFNGNHGPWPSFLLRLTWPYPLDATLILRAALCKSNSSSVSFTKNDSASTLCLKPQEKPLFFAHAKACSGSSTRAHKIHTAVKFVLFLQTGYEFR